MREQSVHRYKQWQVHHHAARDVGGAEEKIEARSCAKKVEDFSTLQFCFFFSPPPMCIIHKLTWPHSPGA